MSYNVRVQALAFLQCLVSLKLQLNLAIIVNFA